MSLPVVEIVNLSRAGKRLMSKSLRPNLRGLLSIGDPGSKLPAGFRNAPLAVRLEFDDVTPNDKNSFYTFPVDEDILRIIKFAEALKSAQGTIIVHCFAGRCRSTAAGFIMHSVWLGPGNAEEAMRHTLASCREPDPLPNIVMLEMADRLLERNGELLSAFTEFFTSSRGMY